MSSSFVSQYAIACISTLVVLIGMSGCDGGCDATVKIFFERSQSLRVKLISHVKPTHHDTGPTSGADEVVFPYMTTSITPNIDGVQYIGLEAIGKDKSQFVQALAGKKSPSVVLVRIDTSMSVCLDVDVFGKSQIITMNNGKLMKSLVLYPGQYTLQIKGRRKGVGGERHKLKR